MTPVPGRRAGWATAGTLLAGAALGGASGPVASAVSVAVVVLVLSPATARDFRRVGHHLVPGRTSPDS
jgi:hypothetical protein